MYRFKTQRLFPLVALGVLAFSSPLHGATPFSAAPRGPMPSNFPGPLWQVISPRGGTASVSNSHLFLNVPGGSNHDVFEPANESLRVVQPIGNVDFDISVKIDSPLEASHASTKQGLMVMTDNRNFITFALTTDGNNIGLSAQVVAAGQTTTVFDQATFGEYQNPMYLRLGRAGNAYIAYYSVDGAVWTQVANFNDPQVPALIGPFASNFNPNPAKAVPVVMAINWFNVL